MSAAASTERCSPPLLPPKLLPMLARAADGPLDNPAYAYEIKWDGMRILAGVDGGRVSLRTRNGLEALPRFPELEGLGRRVAGGRTILDGELVTMRGARPDFWQLQQRIQASRVEHIHELANAMPAALIVFDVLRADDRWLLNEPWQERRRLLEQLVAEDETVQLSPVWSEGKALWSTVGKLDLEGVMAKLRSGRYTPGIRSAAWLKIKVQDTLDAVVCGWTEGTGERHSSLGALVLGRFEDSALRYIGRVGSGFGFAGLQETLDLLRPLESPVCPFSVRPVTNARVHWVRPVRVCEVRHQGWSADRRLRAPVFVKWRLDKPAEECRE